VSAAGKRRWMNGGRRDQPLALLSQGIGMIRMIQANQDGDCSMKQWMRAALAGVVFMGVGIVQATPDVRVEGLFKGAAVLAIDGQQVMLREGKTGPGGVRLVSATSRSAVIEVDGKRHELTLHAGIGGQFKEAELKQVVIRKNNNDQYLVNGSINGQSVQFLVDTGATTVAMNEMDARRLGLQYRIDGKESQVVTAGGVNKSWVVQLDSVKVGEIQVANVEAVVVQGGFPTQVLLGMTYLNHVKLQEQNSVLMLEKKY
jgi:aspartyl protease family protein